MILGLRHKGRRNDFRQLNFDMRPGGEPYDFSRDPDCTANLAADRAQSERPARLGETMIAVPKKEDDSRMFGKSDVFDDYTPTKNAGFQKLSNSFGKLPTNRVSPEDFKKQED